MAKKDVMWNWGERHQRAFEELKRRFTIELVLVILDLDKEMRVKTDTSDFATGELLLMKCEDKN